MASSAFNLGGKKISLLEDVDKSKLPAIGIKIGGTSTVVYANGGENYFSGSVNSGEYDSLNVSTKKSGCILWYTGACLNGTPSNTSQAWGDSGVTHWVAYHLGEGSYHAIINTPY